MGIAISSYKFIFDVSANSLMIGDSFEEDDIKLTILTTHVSNLIYFPDSGAPKFQIEFYPVEVRRAQSDQTLGHLFDKFTDYTFRDYGPFRNFDFKGYGSLTIKEYYLNVLKSSQIIPLEEIDSNINRIYGISIFASSTEPLSGQLNIWAVKGKFKVARIYDYGIDGIKRLLEHMKDAKVVGLYAGIHGDWLNLLVLVDDKTRAIFNILIAIYTSNVTTQLIKNKTPLTTVLDNLDLYHCISLGL